MAQQGSDDFNIDPSSVDGTALADVLNTLNEALLTSRSGASRPPTAKYGTLWLDTHDASTHYLSIFDNIATDMVIAVIDVETSTVSLPYGIINSESLGFDYSAENLVQNDNFALTRKADHGEIALEFFADRWITEDPLLQEVSVTHVTEAGYATIDLVAAATAARMGIKQGIRKLTEANEGSIYTTYTVSFDIKRNTLNTQDIEPYVEMRWSNASDYVGASVIAATVFDAITISDVWNTYEYTFRLETAQTANDIFFLDVGCTDALNFIEGFQIRKVKLEVGSGSTPYKPETLYKDKQDCNDFLFYLEEGLSGSGYATTLGSQTSSWCSVPISMQALPIVTLATYGGNDLIGTNVTNTYTAATTKVTKDIFSISYEAIASGEISWQLDQAYIKLDSEYL